MLTNVSMEFRTECGCAAEQLKGFEKKPTLEIERMIP